MITCSSNVTILLAEYFRALLRTVKNFVINVTPSFNFISLASSLLCRVRPITIQFPTMTRKGWLSRMRRRAIPPLFSATGHLRFFFFPISLSLSPCLSYQIRISSSYYAAFHSSRKTLTGISYTRRSIFCNSDHRRKNREVKILFVWS